MYTHVRAHLFVIAISIYLFIPVRCSVHACLSSRCFVVCMHVFTFSCSSVRHTCTRAHLLYYYLHIFTLCLFVCVCVCLQISNTSYLYELDDWSDPDKADPNNTVPKYA